MKQAPSFLKKRSKKLLSIRDRTETSVSNSVPKATDKSFLLLFFKKEALASLSVLSVSRPTKRNRMMQHETDRGIDHDHQRDPDQIIQGKHLHDRRNDHRRHQRGHRNRNELH